MDGVFEIQTEGKTNTKRKPVIFVADDDAAFVRLLKADLPRAEFVVREARFEKGFLDDLVRELPSVLLLNTRFGRASGIETCKRIRKFPYTRTLPVILMMDPSELRHHISRAAIGADDYISKPFDIDDLIAKLHAIIRDKRPTTVSETFCVADLTLDLTEHRVIRAGRDLHLPPVLFRLLQFLMERPGQALSLEQILGGVWGHNPGARLTMISLEALQASSRAQRVWRRQPPAFRWRRSLRNRGGRAVSQTRPAR